MKIGINLTTILLLILSKNTIQKCGFDYEKQRKITIYKTNSWEGNDKRFLQAENWTPIKIYLDYTSLDSQASSLPAGYADDLKKVMTTVVSAYQTLITVKSSGKSLKLPANACDNDQIKIGAQVTNGVDADLVLFPLVDFDAGPYVEAAASFCTQDLVNSRPTSGFVAFNKNLKFTKKNAFYYFSLLVFHEINHVLSMNPGLFDSYIEASTQKPYPDNKVQILRTINGIQRTMIATPKVLATAKKHYNCDSLEGLELENDGGSGTAGAHWEERILAGDIMIGESYGENVISEMTLALMEDSGWYKTNYYTGGLFRFGKNQGCSFLNAKCIINEKTNFPNEYSVLSNTAPACFASRTSKGVSTLRSGINIANPNYIYWIDKTNGGQPNADYCPIANDKTSSSTFFYQSCWMGNSLEFPASMGEKMGGQSVCFISSLTPQNDAYVVKYKNKNNAICYEIECNDSDKTYLVKIKTLSITCPKEGGEVTLSGFDGKLYCADYNLVCTKSATCNDVFDCISKKVTINNYVYDYTPKVSNNIPPNTSSNTPTNISGSSPTNTSGSSPTNTSGNSPTNTSGSSTASNISGSTPTNTSESTPTNTSGSTPTNISDSTHIITSGSTPTNTSGSTPKNSSGSTPTNTSGITPPNTSGGSPTNSPDDGSKTCYDSCLTCSFKGDSTDHKCLTCKYKFFPLENDSTKCFDTPPYGFYLDSLVVDPVYRQCYSECKTCDRAGSYLENNCLSCKSKFLDIFHNCLSSAPNGYYIDQSDLSIKKCFGSCATCNISGSTIQHNCLTCKTGLIALNISGKVSCYQSAPEGYYLDDSEDPKFVECHPNCKECYGKPSKSTNCKTCNSNYINTKTNNCVTSAPIKYYLNQNSMTVDPCYITCKTCSAAGNSNTNNCIECDSFYFPLQSDPVMCLSTDSIPLGYFLDSVSKIVSSCYVSCRTCSGYGTVLRHNCLTCKEGYIRSSSDQTLCLTDSSYSQSNPIISANSTIPLKQEYCNGLVEENIQNSVDSFDPQYFHEKSPINIKINFKHMINKIQTSYGIKNVVAVSQKYENFSLNIVNTTCNQLNVAYNSGLLNGYYELQIFDYNGKKLDSSSSNFDKILINNVVIPQDSNSNAASSFIKFIPETINSIISANNEFTDPITISTGISSIQIYSLSEYSIRKMYSSLLKQNLPIVDLGDCEIQIRKKNNFTRPQDLILSKIDSNNNGTVSTSLKLYDSKGNEVDTSICKDSRIIYNIPIKFPNTKNNTSPKRNSFRNTQSTYDTQQMKDIYTHAKILKNLTNRDLFNINDPFYIDICLPFSYNGVDLTLDDRFYAGYPGFYFKFPPGCSSNGMDDNYYIGSSCSGNITSNINYEIINTGKFDYDNITVPFPFYLSFIKCIPQAFNKQNIYDNNGFYFNLALIILSIIPIFLMNLTCLRENNISKFKDQEYFMDEQNQNNNHIIISPVNNDNNEKEKFDDDNIKNKNEKNIVYVSAFQTTFKFEKTPLNNKNSFDHFPSYYEYMKLDPSKAFLLDKRTFCEIFLDTLANNHIILGIFFKDSLLFPLFIRIYSFIFSLSCDFGFNVIFFHYYYISDRFFDTVNRFVIFF